MTKEISLQSVLHTSIQKPYSAAIAEISSALCETHRDTEVYYYGIRNHKLFSPTHKMNIEDVAVEYEDQILVRKLQNWANSNQEGRAIWLSPPIYQNEKETKIVLFTLFKGRNYEMVRNELNWANLSSDELHNLANLLYSFSIDPLKKMDSFSSLREDLIIFNLHKPDDIIDKYFNPENAWGNQKIHIRNAQRVISQNNYASSANIMLNSSGNYDLICLPKKSNLEADINTPMVGLGERILKCKCPFCLKLVDAKISAGKIHCPNCGKSADYFC